MSKNVRYNGGNQSYLDCTNPEKLVIGKEYEVLYVEEGRWQTNYILAGVEGEFNSVWFDEV